MHDEPHKEHLWLAQLLGEWSYDSECDMEPGRPPSRTTGTEKVRALGGLWVVLEGQGEMPGGAPHQMLVTLGYDPELQRYRGTWIGSMMARLWIYDGTLDAGGRVLTLASDGPSMCGDGTTSTYHDIIEIVDRDHRTFRSRALGADGTWNEFLRMSYRRLS